MLDDKDISQRRLYVYLTRQNDSWLCKADIWSIAGYGNCKVINQRLSHKHLDLSNFAIRKCRALTNERERKWVSGTQLQKLV